MNKLILASAIAALGAMPISSQAAISFDADGTGSATAKTIDAFDWSQSSFLALGGQQAIYNYESSLGACTTVSCSFDVLTHAALQGATLEGDIVNLGYAGEITMIMRFTETVTDVTGSTATFATVPGTGWVELYYDSTPESNALTGSGFNDGQLILSGTLVSASDGTFTVTSATPVPYDQLTPNQYTGQETVTGTGSQGNLAFENLATDAAFFKTALASFGIQFSNISIALPFISTNPSDCYTVGNAGQAAVGTSPAVPTGSCDNTHVIGLMSVQTDPGANGIVPDIGPVNGLLAPGISFGPDFTAQTDYNSPFVAAVPEPGSLALLGLGLFAFGISRRKQ